MTKVVNFKGGPVIERVPDPNVVECLVKLLALAKAGEVVGFAGVAVYHDQAVGSSSAGWKSLAQLGELTVMMGRMARKLEDVK